MTSSRRDIVLSLPHVCLNRLGFFCPLCLLRQRVIWRTGKANGNFYYVLELSCKLWPCGQESPTLHQGLPLDDWCLTQLFVRSSWAVTAHPPHSEACTHVQEHKAVMIHLIQRCAHMSKNTNHDDWSTSFRGRHACPRAQNPDAMSLPFRVWFLKKKIICLEKRIWVSVFPALLVKAPLWPLSLWEELCLSEGSARGCASSTKAKQYLWESKSGQSSWYFPKVGDPLGDLVENSFKNVFLRLKF